MRARRLDELTAREQEVLQLIRAGLTNEEIAERLGISPDGAKYHVSQILGKLGVASREEAARIALAERRPWWTRALGLGMAVKVAGAAVVIAAAGGIGVLAWSVAGGGRSSEDTLSQLTPTTSSGTDDIAGWQTYRDEAGGFEFRYPSAPGGPSAEPPPGTVRIQLPFTAGTNLGEKYLDVTIGPAGGDRCPPPLGDPAAAQPSPVSVMINGIAFNTARRAGVAAGNTYDLLGYSVMTPDGACAGLTFVLHSANRGNFQRPPPEFDSAAESAVFQQIMSTFVWTP